jgi:hypothetical protein
VAAACLADVVIGDTNPLVALGSGDDLFEQPPVGLLLGTTPGELGLGLAQSHDQPVADALEIGGAEQPRPADGPDSPLQALTWERGGEELAQPALEASDLAAEVVAGRSLGGDGTAAEGWIQRRRPEGRT